VPLLLSRDDVAERRETAVLLCGPSGDSLWAVPTVEWLPSPLEGEELGERGKLLPSCRDFPLVTPYSGP